MSRSAGHGPQVRRLAVELTFPPLAADLDGVAVHVRVEDIGEADAPARLLLQRGLPGRAGCSGLARQGSTFPISATPCTRRFVCMLTPRAQVRSAPVSSSIP